MEGQTHNVNGSYLCKVGLQILFYFVDFTATLPDFSHGHALIL